MRAARVCACEPTRPPGATECTRAAVHAAKLLLVLPPLAGSAYARMMVEGHKMNLLYYDPYPNKGLEEYIRWGVGGCQGDVARWWLFRV